MTDPGTLMSDMDDLVRRLDAGSKELYSKEERFQELSESWDDHFNEKLNKLAEHYELEGKRMPGEDVRTARIKRDLKRVDPDLYQEYHQLKGDIDRLERRARRVEKAISAKQSMLSFLKTEMSAVQ